MVLGRSDAEEAVFLMFIYFVILVAILVSCVSPQPDKERTCINLYKSCMKEKRNSYYGREFCDQDYEECTNRKEKSVR